MDRRSAPFPQGLRPLTALLVATALLTSGCGLFPVEEEMAPPPLEAPPRPEKEIYTVRRGEITDRVTMRAVINSGRQATLYFKQGGRVKAVHVASGDQVTAGQVLAELESGELAYDLAAAEINLKKAQLSLEEARAQALAQSEWKRKELDVELARLQVERLTRRQEESRLVAPFSGQVTTIELRPGDAVQGYQPLVQIVDPSERVIEADVPAGDLSRLAINQRVQVDFSEFAGPIEGTLVQLPESGATSRAARVKVDPLPAAATLGMTGRAHVLLETKADALLLPRAFLRQFAGRTYVLTQTPEGRREIDVTPGIESDYEVEIVRGLKEGDQVIGR